MILYPKLSHTFSLSIRVVALVGEGLNVYIHNLLAAIVLSHSCLPVDMNVLDRLKPVSGVGWLKEEWLLLVVVLLQGTVHMGFGICGLFSLPHHAQDAEDKAGGQ